MIEIPSDLNDASVKEAADYYYYKWRINYVPANTKEKNTTIKWKILQEAPLLEDQHKVWKDNGIDGGIALVMGKFWNNALMEGKFLNCIDMDNKAAIEAWYTKNGKKSLEELAQSYPIEQHADDMNRAHIYIITRDRPLKNKAANRDKDPNVPAMEVMGKGKYVCCTPSTHKNGYKYRFMYGLKPIEEYEFFNADEIENLINEICVEYGIPYLDRDRDRKVNGNSNGRTVTVQTVDDEDEDEKWYEGERHSKLLSKADSLMIKLFFVLSVIDIRELIYAKNKKNCVPPLPDSEVEQICKDAEKYANEQIAKEIGYDNGNGNGKGSTNTTRRSCKGGKANNEDSVRKIPIKKYSGDGRIPLHECIVLNLTPTFVTLDKEGKPNFIESIEITPKEVLIPGDTIGSHNPLPYVFESKEEFNEYLELAKNESFDSVFSKVELVFKKYVDVEDYYYPILVGDIIWSYFQDKFGYTHYNIFLGDNGSGKNSALLVYKYLGYRVFYISSVSAANYYTQLGNKEEGQCTIAEDEAEDMAYDRDKKNVINTGYCSGGSVPKVELEGGRRQDSWLTYCHKWFAMEEIPNERRMKATLDRSLLYYFIPGHVLYNIKDVIRGAGDPKFEPLLEELKFVHKLLFCFRLVHYNDPILDVGLNIENRSAELTKSLIRLFANAPNALQKIIDSLSKFMVERNEIKAESFESKLYDAIIALRDEYFGQGRIDERQDLFDLSNKKIKERLIEIVEAEESLDKPGTYDSAIVGTFTQTRITLAAKSRFKAKPVKMQVEKKTVRGLQFGQKNLSRVKSNYVTINKIEVKPAPIAEDFRTLLTLWTLSRRVSNDNEDQNHAQNDIKIVENSTLIPSERVSEVSKVSGSELGQNSKEDEK